MALGGIQTCSRQAAFAILSSRRAVGRKEYRLTPVVEEGSPDLFFVCGDQTNRTETYGAGRFLYAAPPQDGYVVLDFNRAYNPPCAFSAFATCPLPAKENKLALKVE